MRATRWRQVPEWLLRPRRSDPRLAKPAMASVANDEPVNKTRRPDQIPSPTRHPIIIPARAHPGTKFLADLKPPQRPRQFPETNTPSRAAAITHSHDSTPAVKDTAPTLRSGRMPFATAAKCWPRGRRGGTMPMSPWWGLGLRHGGDPCLSDCGDTAGRPAGPAPGSRIGRCFVPAGC